MLRRCVSAVALAAVALALGCTKAPSDAALAESIRAQFSSDQDLKSSNLNVAVHEGVATISGGVPDASARLEAYKVAAQTTGVKKVDDQMSIEAPQSAEVPPAQAVAPAPVPIAEPPAPKAERKSKRRSAAVSNSDASPQPPASPDGGESADTSADATPPDVAPNAPAPAPVLAQEQNLPGPKEIEIAAGTKIRVRMIDPVNSAVNHTGEVFHASLENPILVNNEVVVPKGADVYIRLTRASTAGSMSGRSELHLELVKLDYGGRSYALVSSSSNVVGGSRGKKTAETVGAGAVIGTIIGAIAGGGRGAAIGAGVGAAGGGIYQASTKGQQVKVPAETLLDFQLEQPATVTVPFHPDVASD